MVKVFIRFGDYVEFRRLTNEAQAADNGENTPDVWATWIQFVVSKKIVREWQFTDFEGKPLDPHKVDSYQELSMYDFREVIRYTIAHVNGVEYHTKN